MKRIEKNHMIEYIDWGLTYDIKLLIQVTKLQYNFKKGQIFRWLFN